MEIEVRRACDSDLTWLVKELKAFSDSLGTTQPFPGEIYAREWMTNLVKNHLVLIAEKGSRKVGFIAGVVIDKDPLNPAIRVLSELFWWVPPELRGSLVGAKLLDAFTVWGKQNVDRIHLGVRHDSSIKNSSLLKRGYRPKERTFLLEVER